MPADRLKVRQLAVLVVGIDQQRQQVLGITFAAFRLGPVDDVVLQSLGAFQHSTIRNPRQVDRAPNRAYRKHLLAKLVERLGDGTGAVALIAKQGRDGHDLHQLPHLAPDFDELSPRPLGDLRRRCLQDHAAALRDRLARQRWCDDLAIVLVARPRRQADEPLGQALGGVAGLMMPVNPIRSPNLDLTENFAVEPLARDERHHRWKRLRRAGDRKRPQLLPHQPIGPHAVAAELKGIAKKIQEIDFNGFGEGCGLGW